MATSSQFFTLLLTLVFLSPALAVFSVPSFGTQGAAETRSRIPDKGFLLDFDRGITLQGDDFIVKLATFADYPALGAVDTQVVVSYVEVKPRQPLFSHYHPRSSEVYYAISGRVRVSFFFEGVGDAREVTNVLMPGQASVVPQALVHSLFCLEKKESCKLVAFFNSADPGTVPVTKDPSPL